MPEYFYPFDSGPGTTVTSAQWSHMTSMWQTDGVRAPRAGEPDPLGASVTGQDMTITLAPGHATVQGHHYHSDAPQNVVVGPNTGTAPRIDRITVRLDRTAQRIQIAYLTGTPGAKPLPPTLSQGQDGIVDVPLARVIVAPQAGAIRPADVIDERVFALTQAVYANAGARQVAPEMPVPGKIAYLQDEQRLELRTESAWVPLSPGPWNPLPLPHDVKAHGGSPSWRIVNGEVHLSGSVERKDGRDFNPADSWLLATLPQAAQPHYMRSFICATSRNDKANNSIRIDVTSNSDPYPGQLQAMVLSPVKWIYLDAIRFAVDTTPPPARNGGWDEISKAAYEAAAKAVQEATRAAQEAARKAAEEAANANSGKPPPDPDPEKDPADKDSMPVARNVISIARREVGYHEGRNSDGHWNNQEKYAPQVPGLEWAQGQAWCHVFVSWAFQAAGAKSLAPVTASCATGVDWFKQRGRWSDYPVVGGVVYYGDGGGEHVGICVAYTEDTITTVEGNTNDNGSSEGDGVYLRTRPRKSDRIYGYGIPAYPEGVVLADPARKGQKGVVFFANQADERDIPAGRSAASSGGSGGDSGTGYEPFPGEAWFKSAPNSPIITAMGRRLVEEGCGAYEQGPGPQWMDADRESVRRWQKKLGNSPEYCDGWFGPKQWAALKVPQVIGK
ncbi:peptidoglycan-binding protein [Streptomyces syringium]|uniref:peptidoglycan-binding protein n=1 Tax=Streptomyces syringium TaxID=76729 RepID=UPI003451B995